MLEEQEKLNFVSIATNNYLDFWKKQAQSIDDHLTSGTTCTLYLFTDQSSAAQEFAQSLVRVKVKIVSIPSYGWPEATLFRYKLISEHAHFWNPKETLVYLDADMLVVDTLEKKNFAGKDSSGVTLILHPGFFRPSGMARVVFYLRNFEFALRDLFSMIVYGGLGTWETRRRSLAFVRRRFRKEYYCGGIWWGPAGEITQLSQTLDSRIDKDLARGVIAVWHDESHLNWWAQKNDHLSASPEYCHSDQFPALKAIPPKVVAVTKRT